MYACGSLCVILCTLIDGMPKTLPLKFSPDKYQTMIRITMPRMIGAILLCGTLFSQSVNAQTKTDKSGMTASKKDDRPSPPQKVEGTIGDLKVTISYSAPGVKGRKIFGELVPFDKVWRTGANEATTVEISRDCKVGGSFLRAGKYALFTIPGEKEWTIIFNTAPDQWGAYKYDDTKDALRFKVVPATTAELNERLKFEIIGTETGEGKVSLFWDHTQVTWEMR